HVVRTVAVTVAALIGRERAEAGGGERRNLVAPGVRQLGEAVAEHDGRAAALVANCEEYPVRGDDAIREASHGTPLSHARRAPGNSARLRQEPARPRPTTGAGSDSAHGGGQISSGRCGFTSHART